MNKHITRQVDKMDDQVKMLCHENCKHKEDFGTISICKKFNHKHLSFDVKNNRSVACSECKESNAIKTILVHQL